MPTLDNLSAEPTVDKLNKAIDSFTQVKASGSNRIPLDLIKICKTTIFHPLHKVLRQCWEEGAVSQNKRNAKNHHTLQKNKGDRSDCNNYRGVSLLSVVGKILL